MSGKPSGYCWEVTWEDSRYRGRWADRSTRMMLKGMLIIPGLPVLYLAVVVLAAYLLA